MIFEVKISYKKASEDGLVKKVTETYLIKAYTFAEAEKLMAEYAEAYAMSMWNIKAIRVISIFEIVRGAVEEPYYEFKLGILTLDECTGREKQQNIKMLLSAENMDDAKLRLKGHMKGTFLDYKIVRIQESPIVDIIGFDENK